MNALAPGALRELGEEEDGYIADDDDGLRISIGRRRLRARVLIDRADLNPSYQQVALSRRARENRL